MLGAGLLQEVCPPMETETKRRGRRCTALQCRAEGAYVISVAITAYSQEVLIGNLKGHIVYSKAIQGFFSLNPEELLHFITDSMRNALQASGIPQGRLLGGSLTLPRQVLLPVGKLLTTPINGCSALEKLEKNLGIGLITMRISEVLNLAEVTWGASRGFENVLCLHLTNLVGASLLHGGALLPPPDTIANISGLPIARAGIKTTELARIENTVSGMSILQRLGLLPDATMLSSYRFEDTLNLALAHAQSLAGNTAAQAAFADAGEWMGHALETLYHAYHPDVIIFAGSLTENTYYLEAMQNAWHTLHPAGPPVPTRIATLTMGTATILTTLEMYITSSALNLEGLLSLANPQR